MEESGRKAREAIQRPMRTQEVAEYLGLSERQVLRMVHDGQIPAVKFGHHWFFSPKKVAELVGMNE